MIRWLPSNSNYFVLVFKNVLRILRSQLIRKLSIRVSYLETYQIIYICCFVFKIALSLQHQNWKYEHN
jgi:hypothetical protein